MSIEVASEPSRARGFWRRHGVKLLVSIVLTVVFGWTLQRGGFDLWPSWSELQTVSVPHCAVYMLFLIAWHAIRALRWRHLLAPIANVPLRRILAVSWIGFA